MVARDAGAQGDPASMTGNRLREARTSVSALTDTYLWTFMFGI
jgi:hypothetical protein